MAVNGDASSTEIYGRLKEGAFIAGFTFERACTHLEWLLEEDRWKLGGTYDDVNAFLTSIKLDQFRIVAEQRKRLAQRIKALQPTASQRAIARVVGVTNVTVHRDLAAENGPAEAPVVTNVAASPAADLSGAAAATLVNRREKRKARDADAATRRIEMAGEGTIECRHGDFRAVLADLTDIDAIITDPPYGREYLPLLRDLAALADRILKPNGIMAVLYGHTWLPEAFAQMTGFRPYRWTACYLTEGNGYISQARKVQSKWKPLLIYGGSEHRFDDLFRSGGDSAAKEHHEWGQDLGAFQSIINALTKPGATVVDPFAGGGTTLIAAKSLGRHAIGSEIEADAMAFRLEAA
jgi:DNA modification methylase